MKTKFTLNPIVLVALPQVCDTDRLIQAVEAYMNGMKVVTETAKRGGLKEVKKSADSRVTETSTTEYSGERNIVSNFIQWHDRVVSLASRAVKFGCVLSCAEIPPIYADWIKKFSKAGSSPEAKPKAKTEKANGPANRALTPA